MTNNKNIKLSNPFVKYVKFIDASKISYNEYQQREIKLSEKVDIYLTDFTLKTIEFVNTCKFKKEIMTAKKYAIKSYAVHKQSESRINWILRKV